METVVKEVVAPEPEKAETEPTKPAESKASSGTNEDFASYEIADTLGVDPERLSGKEKLWLSEIYTWAKKQAGKDSDIHWVLIHKRNELGAPPLGESRLTQLHRWLTAYQGYKNAEMHLKSLERGY